LSIIVVIGWLEGLTPIKDCYPHSSGLLVCLVPKKYLGCYYHQSVAAFTGFEVIAALLLRASRLDGWPVRPTG